MGQKQLKNSPRPITSDVSESPFCNVLGLGRFSVASVHVALWKTLWRKLALTGGCVVVCQLFPECGRVLVVDPGEPCYVPWIDGHPLCCVGRRAMEVVILNFILNYLSVYIPKIESLYMSYFDVIRFYKYGGFKFYLCTY